MRVTVDAPQIAGDTVRYSWEQSEPNPFQHQNGFFIRYEGIDVTRFSIDLFHEIFLSWQLRVFAAYDTPVEITFSQPIPAPTARFWTAYHGATQVTISPIADVASYSPWSGDRYQTEQPRGHGVFFGGGKDSMSISCLLAEVKGIGDVVLFQFVHPFSRGKSAIDTLTARQANLMIDPAREVLGFTTQRGWTDYLAQFQRGFAGKPIRPHLELYSMGFLPTLLYWGVTVCTPGLGRTAYRIFPQNDGSTTYRYRQSRPEMLRAQSRYLQRTLGINLTVTNLNVMLGPLMAFRLLAERYPDALQEVTMCVSGGPNQRWCYHCTKCVEYVYFSLRCGVIDERFDYDYFFRSSEYIKKLIAYAETGVELTQHGNAPWRPFMTIAGAYGVFCHAIAHIQPSLLADRIGPEALTNLLIIKALFGNAIFPNMEMLARSSIDAIGTDLARDVAAVIAEHFPVVDDLPRPFVIGTGEAIFDYGHRMVLPEGLEEPPQRSTPNLAPISVLTA